MAQNRSSLYDCRVYHRRYVGWNNAFRYGVYLFAIDLDEVEALQRRFGIGHNRFAIFSLYDSDHFKWRQDRAGKNLRQLLEDQLAEMGAGIVPARVTLLTGLRVLGYVFNPVSFFYCYDENDRLIGVLAEVNNTYLEQKPYFVPAAQISGAIPAREKKLFYVSPFIRFDSDFRFFFRPPGQRLRVRIDSAFGPRVALKATLSGERRTLTRLALLRAFLRYPLVTVQVIFLIHWQALKLLWKRTPYFPKLETDQKIKEAEGAAKAMPARSGD